MSDIVERLRILQRVSEQIASRVSGEGEAAEIYRRAADEIEQLRAAPKEGREIVALWMMGHGYATGHGDTIEDLLGELELQAGEQAIRARVLTMGEAKGGENG